MNTQTTEVVLCPEKIVQAIQHETESVYECWMNREIRYSQREASVELEIDKGNFTRLLDEQIAIPKNKRRDFMALMGNLLPLQFEAMQFGCLIVPFDELEKLRKRDLYPTVRLRQ